MIWLTVLNVGTLGPILPLVTVPPVIAGGAPVTIACDSFTFSNGATTGSAEGSLYCPSLQNTDIGPGTATIEFTAAVNYEYTFAFSVVAPAITTVLVPAASIMTITGPVTPSATETITSYLSTTTTTSTSYITSEDVSSVIVAGNCGTVTTSATSSPQSCNAGMFDSSFTAGKP